MQGTFFLCNWAGNPSIASTWWLHIRSWQHFGRWFGFGDHCYYTRIVDAFGRVLWKMQWMIITPPYRVGECRTMLPVPFTYCPSECWLLDTLCRQSSWARSCTGIVVHKNLLRKCSLYNTVQEVLKVFWDFIWFSAVVLKIAITNHLMIRGSNRLVKLS